MTNIWLTLPTSTSSTTTIERTNVPVANDTNTGKSFKREVSLRHISRLPRLTPISQQASPWHVEILSIELPSSVWRLKVLNNYVPIDYNNGINEDFLDYYLYGRDVFSSTLQWVDWSRLDLIDFDITSDIAELDEG